ncbi:hypothetical protein E9531_15945 [Lampropedia puyangensis]|uniref:Chromosome partitioning protein ParB n=1 Tax=Lampropedia puyangensis TaxID=1330072 RepID=A0A4S8ESY3_9BURK|nr:ParB/Srx family N-terminal domain-containing protein [Lampropedia puyangensis]THT97468.1 hypothetical protein E9531_15945 [Lampropedia puyangensis]
MRHLISSLATLAGLLALTPAHAQPSPSLVITFSPYFAASATPVPVGPWALFLSIVAIGTALLIGKRKGAGHWMSLPALAALLVMGAISLPQASLAERLQRTISLQTSPAHINLETQTSEQVLVRNDTSQPVRLESLAIDGAQENLRLFAPENTPESTACQSGAVLSAGQACVIEVVASPNFALQEGDVVKVQLKDLHPTQASLGYDQIYYHLARKQPDLNRFEPSDPNYVRQIERTELKRAQDYCEDTGRGKAINHEQRTVSLIEGTGFECTIGDDAVLADKLKTVVVGPNGQLYLTDGHHTFTTLWELSDGGPELPVFVRVAANFSQTNSLASFWRLMQDNQFVWLFDAQGQAITAAQLPERLGLDTMADDPYRSLVYLTRDMGYDNANVQEFAEFYWGLWLRQQGIDIHRYNLQDLSPAAVIVNGSAETIDASTSATSYVAAVRDAALAMRQATPGSLIYPGVTTDQLGQNTAPMKQKDWDDLLKEEVWQDDARESDNRYRNGGKAWYATGYRLCGAPATNGQCWLEQIIVNHQLSQ